MLQRWIWSFAAIIMLGVLAFVFIDLRSLVVFKLSIDELVNIEISATIPFETQVQTNLDVLVNEQLKATVLVEDALKVKLNEDVTVPLNLNLNIPLDTEVKVSQLIDVAMEVPINLVLTENELHLDTLRVSLDQKVFIDDEIEMDIIIPLDTTITAYGGVPVPVKADIPVHLIVPIKQKVRIKDTVLVKVESFEAPLNIVIPIKAKLPFNETLRVKGDIQIPINEEISFNVNTVIDAPVVSDFPVIVNLEGKLPVTIDTVIQSNVLINQTLPIKLDSALMIHPDNIEIGLKAQQSE